MKPGTWVNQPDDTQLAGFVQGLRRQKRKWWWCVWGCFGVFWGCLGGGVWGGGGASLHWRTIAPWLTAAFGTGPIGQLTPWGGSPGSLLLPTRLFRRKSGRFCLRSGSSNRHKHSRHPVLHCHCQTRPLWFGTSTALQSENITQRYGRQSRTATHKGGAAVQLFQPAHAEPQSRCALEFVCWLPQTYLGRKHKCR